MKKNIQQVKEFHDLFQFELPTEPIKEQTLDSVNQGRVIFEEVAELFAALGAQDVLLDLCKKYIENGYKKHQNKFDIVEISDALGDILYVVYGEVLKTGLTNLMPLIFDHIQESNMSKACPSIEDAKKTIELDKQKNHNDFYEYHIIPLDDNKFMVKRSDGKVIKSASYQPTTIKESFFNNKMKTLVVKENNAWEEEEYIYILENLSFNDYLILKDKISEFIKKGSDELEILENFDTSKSNIKSILENKTNFYMKAVAFYRITMANWQEIISDDDFNIYDNFFYKGKELKEIKK